LSGGDIRGLRARNDRSFDLIVKAADEGRVVGARLRSPDGRAEVISHLLKARQVQQAKRANNFKFADDSASADGTRSSATQVLGSKLA